MEAITRSFISNDWVTIVLVITLLLIAGTKKLFSEDFWDFSRILFSNKYFTSHKRTLSVLNSFSFILFIVQDIIVALFIYYFIKTTALVELTNKPYLQYIQLLLIYTVLTASKYLFEKIIGEIFNITKFLDNYIFYKITYKNLLALFILPFLIFIIYTWQNATYLIFSLFILWVLGNILVLIKYYKQNQKLLLGSWFYFILYLCTLEIAPYFILYKVVTGV